MNFHRRKREKIDISLTPMIDAVFLLLIFFMVTTTFNREAELKIKLPEASTAQESEHPQKIILIINANGSYRLIAADGQELALSRQSQKGLQAALAKLAESDRSLPFIISADAKSPHQAVISALDAAGQLGFNHITFAAKQPGTVQAE